LPVSLLSQMPEIMDINQEHPAATIQILIHPNLMQAPQDLLAKQEHLDQRVLRVTLGV